tara:strand:- start:19 stop:393 length:375 start_codon:yes stop_codon:yes gene_type:complete
VGFFVCGMIGRFGIIMKKILPILILTTLVIGQDTLKTVSGQILFGKFIKTTAKHIVFQETYEIEPVLIEKENVADIMTSKGEVSKSEAKVKKSKFNWYSIPCLCVVAVISMLSLISQGGFPGFP